MLAQQYEVYYIDPTISILKYIFGRDHNFRNIRYNVLPNLHVIRLSGIATMYRSIELFDFLHINTISERIQLRSLISHCDLIWVGYPLWYYVIYLMRDKKFIYDKMDDNTLIIQNRLLRRLIFQVEPKIINRATCVFVTAQQFYDDITKQNPRTYLVPNAVSENTPLLRQKKPNPEKKIFGYVGTISHWFDLDAIRAILNADEKNYVVLAGPNELPKIIHPRLSYFGIVPHEKVPELIQSFDVCLYTFRQTSLLDTIDPVKIYEYLAQNKAVLAVKSRETEKFGDLLSLYSNIEDLKLLAQKNWAQPFHTDDECQQFVAQNCWKVRGDIINHKLEEIISGL